MASNEFQPLQGMSDIHAPEIYLWQMIEDRARRLFSCYGYEELRTPSLEKLSVFKRSISLSLFFSDFTSLWIFFKVEFDIPELKRL